MSTLWLTALEVTYASLAVLAGVYVLVAARPEWRNRFLGWLLLMEGMGHTGLASVLIVDGDRSSAVGYAAGQIGIVSLPLIAALYLLFLGAAFPGPLTRPFRGMRNVWGVGLLGVALASMNITGVAPSGLRAPSLLVVVLMVPVVSIYGLVVATSMFRAAPSGPVRRQAAVYLAAFAVRDVTLAVPFIAYIVAVYGFGVDPSRFEVDNLGADLAFYGLHVVFLVLFIYGALTGQVLGLERKATLTLSSASAAGIVAGVFFLVVEAFEQALDIANPVLAVAVAAGLVLAVLPLRRALERRITRWIPHAQPIAQMTVNERLDVYREQVELAWHDGQVSETEALMLKRLQRRLGLDETDASQVYPQGAGMES